MEYQPTRVHAGTVYYLNVRQIIYNLDVNATWESSNRFSFSHVDEFFISLLYLYPLKRAIEVLRRLSIKAKVEMRIKTIDWYHLMASAIDSPVCICPS